MDQDNTTWTVARTPGVMRETVCTVVHRRTASLDSERGIDDGSEVHEGRRQTVRRELNSQSTGRPRLKLPAFQPDWRKSAVRKRVQEKLVCSVGDRPTKVIVRGLVAWIAERREIEFLMPIDKAIFQDGEQVIGP